MVATSHDTSDVGRRFDEEHMRRFIAARAAGQEADAKHWWRQLLTANADRVRAFVVLESRGRLSADEQEEAVQRAMIRIDQKLRGTFKGSSVGEWVNAVRELVHYECMDTQRWYATRSKHEIATDMRGGDEEDAGHWDREQYEDYRARRAVADDLEAEGEAMANGRVFLDWATERLSPKLRDFLAMEREGLSIEQMTERTGDNAAALYQRRKRLTLKLGELRKEWEA